ncbi:hypothetical protein AAZX31_19G141800 [Glycine max]|uniref:Uncharacterized protein n=2 Tax=Glycine subgen. Soja TaxID=1462606 RepID=I1N9H0_SOYBN|nr:uncharacterized protein LOC100781513 [Glycine max]XP_028217515.1 uncharacterized protein LOC114399517 [Glycine soja]KAG4913143.1 hypothetical protein JHK86_053576 [Glycine max]KAG4916085.1 hypothetical protein JHK87_053642 [Glycine soja]KAG5086330.1 hypothetical protein JHK82_053727 [Glycine max]KAH1077988.1 hypothetical protein GYH30_053170 [Glycine max]KAH1194885.1 hypothetical protein GmHk_19G055552 [Glycine max]|eukprot:XP_003554247.1 uncharacterized protein LOC100781513 [Glycine max]
MASVHDDAAEVGFEEGMLWLPSHVLDEACDSKIHMRNRHQKQRQHGYHRYQRETQSQCSNLFTRSSCQRPKHATGGPGMQAVFLVSGQGSCGTGVFLPQKAGTKSTSKPACAPVLLPARVVQALNLKVHQLGLQISPSQAPKYSSRSGVVSTSESTKKKTDQKDALMQCSVVSQSQSSSPEIFLPKEWTY